MARQKKQKESSTLDFLYGFIGGGLIIFIFSLQGRLIGSLIGGFLIGLAYISNKTK